MPHPRFRAVIFDLGGVVLGSPLHAIAAFEKQHNIPANAINLHVARSHPDGAWHRLERGELLMGDEFYSLFDQELHALGYSGSSEQMMADIHRISQPRQEMLAAIKALRRVGFKVAALTNNWKEAHPNDPSSSASRNPGLAEHFDLFIESAVLGFRKPDPRIYQHTCEALEVRYEQAIFLDDIGTNLKAARALGMYTIKVDDPHQALDQVGKTLGFVADWY